MSIVTFRDDIQSSPKKSNTNEQKALPKRKEPPAKDDLQLCSSSLSIDPNSTCVVDKGRQVSVLERYSDDSASKVTSREGINISVASLETRSAYLSETKEKSEPFGKLHENIPRSDVANKTIRSWLTDPRLYMVSARSKSKLNVFRKRAHQPARVLFVCHTTYPRHLNVLVFCIYCIVYQAYLEIKYIIWQEVSFMVKSSV